MSKIELLPKPHQAGKNGYARSCEIVHVDGDGHRLSQELWFEYPRTVPQLDSSECDSYLVAALLPAMMAGADVYVQGSVSCELLANLTELQKVWVKWCPGIYREVAITADQIRSDEAPVSGAVVAFSGGGDAQFTAYRHAEGLAALATRPVRAGVFVHGFDIPLGDIDGFAGAATRSRQVLEDIGLELLVVRSNIRELWSVNWEHLCGAALSAVFLGMRRYAGTALIGAGEPYDALVVPWGTHPIIDPLMGSGSLRIIHDGAGYSRSEKIKQIALWESGVQNLRVCWVGGLRDRNCGECEKCVRTRLNFLLAGVSHPACFSSPMQRDLLKPIVLRSDAARAEWRLIRDEMARTGIGADLLSDIDKVIKRPATRYGWLLPSGSRRRALVKRIVGKA